MIKIALIVVVVTGLYVAGLQVKEKMDKPSALVACAEQTNASEVAVKRGCEPSEKIHIDAVTTLLLRLPVELSQGDTSLLSAEIGEADIEKALPEEVTITPYPMSWTRTGDTASMLVKVSQAGLIPRSEKYVATFIQTEDGWKVSLITEAK